MDLRAVFTSLFIMLNKKTYILFRIEFLVVVVTVLFLVMSIMDIFRRHFHSPVIKSIFNLLDAVSDSVVLYILGAMQTAPIKNQLFPVWAIVLVNFRNSIDFISGYGVPDRGGRRFTEWRNVVKLLGVAFLYQTRGSKFVFPLWSLWCMQILRSWYRFKVRNLAVRSIWHGGSSSLISEYMRTDHDPSNFKFENCDPCTMEGYKYLVYGETNQSVKLKKPRYALYIDPSKQQRKGWVKRKNTTSIDTLTTLDKIWRCDGRLLNPNNRPGVSFKKNNRPGDDLKDLSLAFALARLLRCRLEDVALQDDTLRINQKLIRTTIIDENAKRAFRIMEMQLAFINDYFNTRYPMVFWCGFPSLFLSLIQSVLTFAVALWLSVDIRKVYKPPDGDTAHLVHGFNIDIIITWVFMVFLMFKEIWEIVTYLISDWTRLLLTCMYERFNCIRNSCAEKVILSFFKSNLAGRWHGVIDQYVFLQSYDNSPTIWNLIHKLTVGMVSKKDEGAELGSAINVPDGVKPAILEKLGSLDLKHGYLPKMIRSLPDVDGDTRRRYRWACFELPTCSHIILVWHIATSLCEMELAKDHDVHLGKPGFLRDLLSYCYCSSKSYLMDEKKLPGKLQENYVIANSLSRYCAYLLVSKTELIPDSFLVPKMIFQETVKHARDHILKDCDSLQSKYEKLRQEGEQAAQETDKIKKGEDVIQDGAMLAKELLDHESKEQLWEILADVWAELLVHIAPSWNAAAHKKCLESGGEFLTHIWALLWHCGIEQSKLWPVEDLPQNSAPEAPQDSNVESNNSQTAQEMQNAGARLEEGEGADEGVRLWNSHEAPGKNSVTETNSLRSQTESQGRMLYEIEQDCEEAKTQIEGGIMSAKDAGEGEGADEGVHLWNSPTENEAPGKNSVTETNSLRSQTESQGRMLYEIEQDCEEAKTQIESGVMSAKDAGEVMASITSTESGVISAIQHGDHHYNDVEHLDGEK